MIYPLSRSAGLDMVNETKVENADSSTDMADGMGGWAVCEVVRFLHTTSIDLQ